MYITTSPVLTFLPVKFVKPRDKIFHNNISYRYAQYSLGLFFFIRCFIYQAIVANHGWYVANHGWNVANHAWIYTALLLHGWNIHCALFSLKRECMYISAVVCDAIKPTSINFLSSWKRKNKLFFKTYLLLKDS
jgi:hypothetical protein